jgi:hypothetical protein
MTVLAFFSVSYQLWEFGKLGSIFGRNDGSALG